MGFSIGGILGGLGSFLSGGSVNGAQTMPVQNQTNDLYKQLLASAQGSYDTEAKFRPLYQQLQEGLIPGAMAAVKGANPAETNLLARLTQQANEGLDQGGRDPAMERAMAQYQRGAQSARGLGRGPADVVSESSALAQLWNTIRNQRQTFATGTSQLLNQQQTMPALALTQTGNSPMLTNSSQYGSLLNLIYGAKNQNAAQQSKNQADTMGSLTSLAGLAAMAFI